MRLVTYDAGSGAGAGLLRDGRVFDIWGEAFGRVRADDRSLNALLRSGLLKEVTPVEGDEGMPVEEVRLLPPVTDPAKVICIGLNYRSHCEEQGVEPPEAPTFFAKFQNALADPGGEVALPPASSKVDYEAEVAFVVADRCADVPVDEALEHVAGYMLFNDLSARDLQFATPQWMPGKVFDGAAPCGPALVSPDEAGAHDAIEIELRLNGERMQSGTTADLVHPVPALVAHLSSLMTLEPGDIVATGTPSGVGSLREPRVWLKPGDEIAIESPQLGTLQTLIAG